MRRALSGKYVFKLTENIFVRVSLGLKFAFFDLDWVVDVTNEYLLWLNGMHFYHFIQGYSNTFIVL